MPTHWSWHAQAHNVATTLAFSSVTVSCLVFVRRFAALKRWPLAAYSVATAVIAPGLVFTADRETAGVFLLIASTLTFGWLVTATWLRAQVDPGKASVSQARVGRTR